MGKKIVGVAVVSLDGFIADDNDGTGTLLDRLGSGDGARRVGATGGHDRPRNEAGEPR